MKSDINVHAVRKPGQRRKARRHFFPSGRSVVLKVAGTGEEVEVLMADGAVELQIAWTEAGAVVSLRGARLELKATEAVVVNSRRFEVHTTEATQLHSAGDLDITGQEMRVQTTSDIHLNGGIIHLNC
jgi:hypothetical protein